MGMLTELGPLPKMGHSSSDSQPEESRHGRRRTGELMEKRRAPSITWSLKGADARPRHSKADSGLASASCFQSQRLQGLALVIRLSRTVLTLVVWARRPKPLRTSSLLTGTAWSVRAYVSPLFEGNTEEVVQLLPGWTPPLLQHLHSHTGFLTCKTSTRS